MANNLQSQVPGWFLLVIFNLVAVLVAGGLIWLTRGELAAKQVAEVRLVELKTGDSRSAENRALLSQIKADSAQVSAYFVTSRGLPTLIESLEKTAVNTGVKLQLTQVAEETAENSTKLRLDLSASGSFRAVTNYLGLLETLPYELVFNNVRLAKGESGKSGNTWQLETALELWSYRDDKN